MKRVQRNYVATLDLPTLRLEGGLFLPDQLEKAALGKASRQNEKDYRVPAGLKLKDEYSRAFQIATALWKQFAATLERQDVDAVAITRRFMLDLLRDTLGYQGIELIEGIPIGERHYPVTALAGPGVPVVIAAHTLGLDEPDACFAIVGSGARKKSPFQLAQEFLNASGPHPWALVGNGKQLRLLRDAATLTRPAFLEFDLQDMLAGQRFAEFEMAWRILHATRAPCAPNDRSDGRSDGRSDFSPTPPPPPPPSCIWEIWRNEGRREGTRVREGLRQGVTEALLGFGNGFIGHPANESLRLDLLEGRLSQERYFQELLRLVYRLIFLFTVEERGLLHPDAEPQESASARRAYAEGYALSRLRDRCLLSRANPFDDLWTGIRIVFRGLAEGEPRLALPALGGLFASSQCPNLDAATLGNASLLNAIRQLRWSNFSGNLAPVDYRNMGPEELGSVYESLLELAPEIDVPARRFGFIGLSGAGGSQGNARKTTGSYYTPDSLVQELIRSALDPVIEDRIAQHPENPTAALLSIKIIDPACGSGHFLLAAARRLAERLALLQAPEGAVQPQDYRHALREVVSRCIFGVDRNPMALELARTALWLEGFVEGAALSFLDHHLICGDALIGLTDPKQLRHGIPEAAFKPLSGDDKNICTEIAKTNKEALKAFSKLYGERSRDLFLVDAAGLSELEALEKLPDTTAADIAVKEAAYRSFLEHARNKRLNHAANLLVGAFLIRKAEAQALVTTPTSQNLFLELFTRQCADELRAVHQAERLAEARQACEKARVLHWPLAFPQVFARGGFDCVLGNPPWERIKLQEEEFFATRNRHIAEAKNKAERCRRIEWLAEGQLTNRLVLETAGNGRSGRRSDRRSDFSPTNKPLEGRKSDLSPTYNPTHNPIHKFEDPDGHDAAERRLYRDFITARRTAEAASLFAHVKGKEGGRYPLTGVGDVNTYALFAETINRLIGPNGRAGFIVPTGIATDDSTKAYFGHIVQRRQLVSLFDIENREKVFPAVDSRMKFCLLTLGVSEQAEFAFFLTNTGQLADDRRRFALTASDFSRINPNTLTCPVFRSRMDAELTRKIYRRVPVLIREARGNEPEQNPWGISFMRMFDMSNDSHLFADSPAPDRLPLYEAKMIHQFDHRWATYRVENGKAVSGDVALAHKQNPHFCVTPRYWVDRAEVEQRLRDKGWNRGWLLGWRDITNATNERTVIASVLPKSGVGNQLPLIFPTDNQCGDIYAALVANFSALILDFVARHKVGGTHLNFFLAKQLPILPPDFYTEPNLAYLLPRVLELTYTSHDLKPWARDLGFDGPPFGFDPERRAIVRAELDAWYARAYGLNRDELRYILDPAEVMGDDYPSETFRVLKTNELREFGEYRTRRLVLEAWDKQSSGFKEK